MKDQTGAIHAQIPVDVATFLLNEKRADIFAIESRLKVSVVLIPNIHLVTPHYKITRLRHDEINPLEMLTPSYRLSETIEETTPAETRKENKPAAQVPVVRGITPAQPAPIIAEKAAEITSAVNASVKSGLIGRIFGWLQKFGEDKPAAATTAVEPVAPTTREHRPQQDSRNRNRSRNDRPPRNEVRTEAKSETTTERPARMERPPRPERAPRQERNAQEANIELNSDKQTKPEASKKPRPPRQPRPVIDNNVHEAAAAEIPLTNDNTAADGATAPQEPRSRRGRRGGRRERRPEHANNQTEATTAETANPLPSTAENEVSPAVVAPIIATETEAAVSAPVEIQNDAIAAAEPVVVAEPVIEVHGEVAEIRPIEPIAVPAETIAVPVAAVSPTSPSAAATQMEIFAPATADTSNNVTTAPASASNKPAIEQLLAELLAPSAEAANLQMVETQAASKEPLNVPAAAPKARAARAKPLVTETESTSLLQVETKAAPVVDVEIGTSKPRRERKALKQNTENSTEVQLTQVETKH